MVSKKLVTLIVFVLTSLSLMAQDEWTVVHDDCFGGASETFRRGALRRLPAINNDWDASKTYHQLVILVSFVDQAFSSNDPKQFYDDMLNKPGYNERQGLGCMAEYFHAQSNGLLNLQFDIFGPYEVSQVAQPYETPDKKTRNYGKESFREAIDKFIEEHPNFDFTPYDWNSDGNIEQVCFIYAGFPGNLGEKTYGYVWPNTSSISTITTPDGKKISNYTASGEVWPTSKPVSCGFGTICHEFSHSLGLPDIYPTNAWAYSICDEWDLMDGGNFTNYGWCPPNYTPLEKILMGWMTPLELTEAQNITNLEPISKGGATYIIRHSDTEFLLLENRQQSGWDAGVPGHGLVIWYVDFDKSAWRGNTPNNRENSPRFRIICADGLDYDAWSKKQEQEGFTTYQNSNRMNKRYFSTAPYPFGEINSLAEEYITNITESTDSLVSFDFKGGASGIRSVNTHSSPLSSQYFDLQGRYVKEPIKGQLYIVRKADGSKYKTICN